MASNGFFSRLGRVRILGASLSAAAILFCTGIFFWGGFNTAMEATNSLEFCISCHEMENNVYQEYKKTIHYENRTGVRATCADCHVPHPWVHKMIRKIQASGELFHKFMGSVATAEKFEAKRLELAKRVWHTMKTTDSRECRNCHSFDAMGAERQKPRARKQHELAREDGQTCIDCHKGIAHKPVHQLLEGGDKTAGAAPAPAVTPVSAPAAAPASAPAPAPASAPAPAPAAAPAAAPAGGPAIDWSKAPAREVKLFYPGQTSYEWVQTGTDHGGARGYLKKGEQCAVCHEGEQADMGGKMVTGAKAEPSPIPGKPAAIPLTVQAAHDGDKLHMRFQWPASPHAPAPFAEGGKMDPQSQVKLAIMLDQGNVTDANRSGCWSTCHHDLKSMPDMPGAPVTKYLPQSRTEIAMDASGKRGGWDKKKSPAELEQLLKDGVFLDLIRWKSNGEVEDGHVLAERVTTGGQGAEVSASQADGKWTVVLSRKLVSDKPGDVSLTPGKTYTIGFAIHDDHSLARFHHVSVEYSLGLDAADAAINVVKQ